MKKLRVGSVLLAGIVAAGAAWAHGGATGIVKERMDAMSDIGEQMKAVGRMLRAGSYDPALVSSAGATIAGHGGKTLVDLFPEGSLEAPTEASPAIWTDRAKFQAYSDDLQAAARAMKQLADRGADKQEIAGAFATLGGTCKTCHEAFRIKK